MYGWDGDILVFESIFHVISPLSQIKGQLQKVA